MGNLPSFLQELMQLGISINTVYDIGAWKGYWSDNLKTSILPNAEFILFEANPAYENDLKRSGFKSFGVVLSNPGRDYVEFFNGTNTGDSYYKENSTIYENQSSIQLQCVTLDQVIKHYNLPIPEFIKLDTQGSELDILRGCSFLDQVSLIYTECPIICYNKGAPTIQDYIDFFREKKFVPIHILEIHRSEDILLQVDILFMHNSVKERFLSPNRIINPLSI
jgi:FkbM family methyltransferase